MHKAISFVFTSPSYGTMALNNRKMLKSTAIVLRTGT